MAAAIQLKTPRLRLRQWLEADREPFAERLGLGEIVSFTAIENQRSRAVMERIGMRNANQDFKHPGVPPGHPLRLHCLYRITRSQWSENAP